MRKEIYDENVNPSGVMAAQFYSSMLEYNCYMSEHKEGTPRSKSRAPFLSALQNNGVTCFHILEQ